MNRYKAQLYKRDLRKQLKITDSILFAYSVIWLFLFLVGMVIHIGGMEIKTIDIPQFHWKEKITMVTPPPNYEETISLD